jgi:hypothetical protein
MYQIIKDATKGTISITDSWSISATGSSAPPQFLSPDDEFAFSYVGITGVEKFKSFVYDYTGQTENRYLTTYYRISRDSNNWTEWLPLNSNITNFPPFTAVDTMYLDIKFIRKGTSTIGTIKLIDYTLDGALERNVLDGLSVVTLNTNNNTVVIKPPYIYKVFKIDDVEVISTGTINTDFTIKYRFSQDYGRTVTDWEYFTKESITTIRISPIRFFQIEYLLELKSSSVQVYDINLIGDFQNVSLDYTKSNVYGIREDCNSIMLGLVNDPSTCSDVPVGGQSGMLSSVNKEDCVLPQLTTDDKNNLFKPYQLPAATNLLAKMSEDANSIFGHDVVYFLTDPDKKGIDYTFHEYSLMNYITDEMIKVSVENNQFPENSGAINQFDLSLFDSFEIHITKDVFKKAFGPEKRPGKEDFLWFCQINKMFTIEHSQPFRGFNNNAIYYKVMLKKYVQKANVIGGNQTIQDRVKELTKNSTIDELFGLENKQDKLAVANKEQFKPLTFDKLRVDITSNIVKELVENAEIVISKSHYDLSSVNFTATQSTDAVTYKNMKNYYKVSDNISYMSWFSINNYTYNDNYHLFNYYDSNNQLGLDITFNSDKATVKLNSDLYDMDLNNGLSEDTWYSYVVNIDQRKGNISQYIYKRDVELESDASTLNSTKLKLVYSKTMDMTPVEFKLENITAMILSGDMKITNLRMFIDIIPEDQHNKILNQAIIRDDSKYLLFADNANQRLVLPSFPLSQVGPNDV